MSTIKNILFIYFYHLITLKHYYVCNLHEDGYKGLLSKFSYVKLFKLTILNIFTSILASNVYDKRIFQINGNEPKDYSLEFQYQTPSIDNMVDYSFINISAVNEICTFLWFDNFKIKLIN